MTRPDPAATDGGGALFPVGRGRLALETLGAAVASWLWAVWTYRLWDISPHVPLHSVDDARLITNLVKNIADQGWWTTNPDLGYPIGQQLYDFPHGGETWQLLIVRVLALFTDSPGLLMNVYFFTGIGVTTAAAHVALRHLRFRAGTALVAALALAWLPFRLGHGQYHLWRTSFWWVPLSIVVVLWTLHWRERFLIDPSPPGHDRWRDALRWNLTHNLRRRRLAVFALMLVVLGGSETMTTAFTLTLLGLLGLVAAARRRDALTLLVHATVAAALALVFLIGLQSTLRFVAANGTNADAARRSPVEQELFGLKISELLLPDPSHRWSDLGEPIRRLRAESPVPSEGGQTIGLLGAAGFLGATVHALTRGWGHRRREDRPPHDRDALRDDLGLIVVTATLVATISGGAIFLSMAGFSQVRVWNRMSLLIGFCSLAFALTWLESGWRRLRPRLATGVRGRPSPRSAVGTALVLALVAGVLWDGSHVRFRREGETFGLDYRAKDAAWEAEAAFARTLDDALPDGTAVFQFPIVAFPEAHPPGRMVDYDHLRAWVHLPPGRLRWSYGAMRGRPDGDWQLKVRDEIGEAGSLPLLIGLGFRAVWVDTWGYDDDGARVRAELDAATGVEPLVSDEGRTLVYDLRPLADALAADGQGADELADEARRTLGLGPRS